MRVKKTKGNVSNTKSTTTNKTRLTSKIKANNNNP